MEGEPTDTAQRDVREVLERLEGEEDEGASIPARKVFCRQERQSYPCRTVLQRQRRAKDLTNPEVRNVTLFRSRCNGSTSRGYDQGDYTTYIVSLVMTTGWLNPRRHGVKEAGTQMKVHQ